ncbi:nucleoside 2-deoxyribosyltransferase [Komagataeibacter intermedius NRIC 0521]|nr:nucleoside 2-deoxyribosyltransferase [Komagataeibacter intermedius NRIC 0521]
MWHSGQWDHGPAEKAIQAGTDLLLFIHNEQAGPYMTTQPKTTRAPRIYLAGDTVFRPAAADLFRAMKDICAAAGLEGVCPFDGQAEVDALAPGAQTSLLIARLDRDLMDGCDAGVFCLDPFRRAADMDPGTAVEIGYMAAQGKMLTGYTVDGRPYPRKVAEYRSRAWGDALRERQGTGGSGGMEDADGLIVHSEGMVQNAMTEGFIRLSGGTVCVDADLLTAFAMAIDTLRQRLLG